MSIPSAQCSRSSEKGGSESLKDPDKMVISNIDVCVSLFSQLRLNYGPNKLNNCVDILNKLQIQNPVARELIMRIQCQESHIVDSNNITLIFASLLLNHAVVLMKKEFEAVQIASYYEEAFNQLDKILLKMLSSTSFENLLVQQRASLILKSSFISKNSLNYLTIKDLIHQLCVRTMSQNAASFNVDNIRVMKILGASVGTSYIMNGMVFGRGAGGDIKKVISPRICVFVCPEDFTRLEPKANYLAFDETILKASNDKVEKLLKDLQTKGVSVVVSTKGLQSKFASLLQKYQLHDVQISTYDLRRLCRIISFQSHVHLTTPGNRLPLLFNYVDSTKIGDMNVVVFQFKPNISSVHTVVVRAVSEHVLSVMGQIIDDTVNTCKTLIRDGRLLERRHVNLNFSSKNKKNLARRYSKDFATALENLPKLLAENAEFKSTEVLSNLYAEHTKGNQNHVINIVSGKIESSVDNNVFDILAAKQLALKLATNAASTILKVGSNTPTTTAGDPPAYAPKGQDDDDDMA